MTGAAGRGGMMWHPDMPTEYRNQIVTGDALDLLAMLPDQSVDLVLTDPPYNAGVDYGEGINDRLTSGEYRHWLTSVIDELERVSRGIVMVFVSITGMLELSTVRRPRWVCAWTKPMSFSHRVGGSPFLPHWEPCLIYGKPWGEGGRVPPYSLGDVWPANPITCDWHPCPKPEPLIRWILSKVPGQVVLDPFTGTGTVPAMCRQLYRDFVAFEKNMITAEKARQRVQQTQVPWFVGEDVRQMALEGV